MSQHDFSIANQTASSARSDINSALQALASNNSGDAAPSTTYANQLWYQTNNNRLQMRNEANTAWLDLGYIDQSDGLEILDNTKLVDTSGTQVGLLGDQSTATWEAGTGNIDSLVSPANIKAAVISNAPSYTPPTANGEVGTYKFLVQSGVGISAGSSYSGSSLLDSGVNAVQSLSTTNTVYNSSATQLARGASYQAGTWRAMGGVTYNSGTPYGRATLFLRIS